MPSLRARELRRNTTDAERRLWYQLRHRQVEGYRFRRQVPLGPYVVDFACLSARLIVELDGGQHTEDQNIAHDAKRTAWLEAQGFRVLRFWNNDVFQSMASVWDTIAAALNDSRITPTLTLPRKGGGNKN